MLGPGKYDDICTKAREDSKAGAIVLVIYDGERGNGYSMQAPPDLAGKIPEMLHDLANQLDAAMKQGSFFAPPA